MLMNIVEMKADVRCKRMMKNEGASVQLGGLRGRFFVDL